VKKTKNLCTKYVAVKKIAKKRASRRKRIIPGGYAGSKVTSRSYSALIRRATVCSVQIDLKLLLSTDGTFNVEENVEQLCSLQ
jgi:hypothetical protein